MKTHELKTYPKYYQPLVEGRKTFEIRKDDRHFQEGEYLILREWSEPGGYSGRATHVKVTYVLSEFVGLRKGYVVLGIKLLGQTEGPQR